MREDSVVQGAARVETRLPDTPSPAVAGDSPLLTIRPAGRRIEINWREIWRYRELLYFLAWRDIKIRYKQTALGAAWAILQPLLTMLVFALFFGRLAGLESKTGGVPYPIYVYIGLLPWTFFANALTSSGNSLVGSANLITKVYFPRLIIPFAAVGVGLADLAVSSIALLAMMAYYHVGLSWSVLAIPVLLVGTVCCAAGVGALLAALNVAYRDFRYVLPFLTQLWMFVTPVIYPVSIIPAKWRWALALNPMAGLMEGFRAAFLGRPLQWSSIGLALLLSLGMFLMGAAYFRRMERRFADII